MTMSEEKKSIGCTYKSTHTHTHEKFPLQKVLPNLIKCSFAQNRHGKFLFLFSKKMKSSVLNESMYPF